MARGSIDSFTISLNKQCFFAGESLSGTVQLVTNTAIKCRSIQLEIEGWGYCHFEVGSGDDRETVTHRAAYWKECRTLWGPYYCTDVIEEGGQYAVFGSPFRPNDGVLVMSVEDRSKQLILRVMDEDWGKRDDLLGEVLVEPERLVYECQQSSTHEVTFPLRRQGKEEKGTVTVSARWLDDGRLRLEVLRAMGLKSGDWFGKNDVYVQAYYPQEALLKETVKLPEPNREAVLPPGIYTWHVEEMKLPDDLPATMESSNGHVRYKAKAYIDIKWYMDPFTVSYFTVMPRSSACFVSPAKVIVDHADKTKHPNCYCPPFCCSSDCACCEFQCCSLGSVSIEGSISSNAGSPGETISVSALATNQTSGSADIVVNLRMLLIRWAEGHVRQHSQVLPLFKKEIPAGASLELVNESITIPNTPPSYGGGLLVNLPWEQKLRRLGVQQPDRWWTRMKKDPNVWSYQIELGLDVHGTPFDLMKPFPFTVTSIPACVQSIPGVMMPPGRLQMGSQGPADNSSNKVPLEMVYNATNCEWVSGSVVEPKDIKEPPSNACSSTKYQPNWFVPKSSTADQSTGRVSPSMIGQPA
jgi:hypothetical protein